MVLFNQVNTALYLSNFDWKKINDLIDTLIILEKIKSLP